MLMINLKDFVIEEIEVNFRLIRETQKKMGIHFPPDFIFFNLNYGKIKHNKKMFSANDISFSMTSSILDYYNNIDYFKELLPLNIRNDYVVFGFSYDPNYFFLMGSNIENSNQVFLFNDALDLKPKILCESMYNLFYDHFFSDDQEAHV